MPGCRSVNPAVGQMGPDEDESAEEYNEEWRYETRAERCPICALTVLTPDVEAAFLRKKAGYANAKATLKAIKAEFKTHAELAKWLGQKS